MLTMGSFTTWHVAHGQRASFNLLPSSRCCTGQPVQLINPVWKLVTYLRPGYLGRQERVCLLKM